MTLRQSARQSSIASRACFLGDIESGREVMSDQEAHLFDEERRSLQSGQEFLAHFGALRVVAQGADPSRFEPGSFGFSEIMAKSGPHQGSVLFVGLPDLGGLIDRQKRVCPDIAFGMPLRVLGNAAQTIEFWEETQKPGFFEKGQSFGGAMGFFEKS